MEHPAVTIIGGGPAGSSAAIAARLEGAAVTLCEKSRLPRHKVCGEFISPGAAPLLRELGVWDAFLQVSPAPIRRFGLIFGARTVSAPLEEPAFGLSRYAFDNLLLEHAAGAGAQLVREAVRDDSEPLVIAHGRTAITPAPARGRRLFGFKAHFTGPASDAIELYFSDGAYVGVSAVEQGRTNVCGIASEWLLARHAFEFDSVVHAIPALRDRLRPMTRVMRWLAAGPLAYGSDMRRTGGAHTYRAGDAIAFVDPFTGSGMLNALTTGILAGRFAARRAPSKDYLRECRARLSKPYLAAALCRTLVRLGWAGRLAGLAPPALLFRMTRAASQRAQK
jgi:flavin-dependent dehydrogenase